MGRGGLSEGDEGRPVSNSPAKKRDVPRSNQIWPLVGWSWMASTKADVAASCASSRVPKRAEASGRPSRMRATCP